MNETETHVGRLLTAARIYWDYSAGADAGWAYQYQYDDGSHESGPVEGIQALADCHGGFSHRTLAHMADVPMADCHYHAAEGGYSEWLAD
jgi:hypothetical protein